MKYIITDTGRKYKRASRWIAINPVYVTTKHRFYLMDYDDGGELYNNKARVEAFRHGGRTYALSQFMMLSAPEFFTDENGKTSWLSGYDMECYYKPFMIELNDDVTHVRLWEVVTE